MNVKTVIYALSLSPLFFTSCQDTIDKEDLNTPYSAICNDDLDTSVRPGDDFDRYANGGWKRRNTLPDTFKSYGKIEALFQENSTRIIDMLQDLKDGSYPLGSVEKKLGDLYALGTDTVRRNTDGAEPIMVYIREMEQAQTMDDLFNIEIRLASSLESMFMKTTYFTDHMDATNNILKISQLDMVLKSRDYYIGKDDENTRTRNTYMEHIVKMLQMLGFSPDEAAGKMNNIMHVKRDLAGFSRSNTELREPLNNYNKVSLSDFENDYPNIRLEERINGYGLSSRYFQELVVGQPEYFAGLDSLLSALTLDEYRDYMEWFLVSKTAKYLDSRIVAQDFDFMERFMNGIRSQNDIDQTVMEDLDKNIGEAVGIVYAKRYFPAEYKERVLQLIRNLSTAMASHIEALDWMSDATKNNALEKLNTMVFSVGYPDEQTDMSGLMIDPAKSYVENVLECKRFNISNNISKKAGKPVNRRDWYDEMYAQTINADYDPSINALVFPAGILQKPVFDMEADDAYNYGAIGSIIGHEFTHGFDDEGRLYDKDGNLRDWWTEQDTEQFTIRAGKLADYFSAIELLPGFYANGQLTLGENLADLGGLEIAWTAYKNATKGENLPTIDGITPDQRFFLAHAYLFCEIITDEAIRNQTNTDPHPIGRWRINGILPHVNSWYDAFGIKEGDKLFIPRNERVSIW